MKAINSEGQEVQIIDQMFNINFDTTWKNTEDQEELETTTQERSYKISCIIDTPGQAISHLHDGIKASLDGQISKFSQTLNRDCVYNKVQRIASLPNYLTINFVRFTWKKASVSAGTSETRAKILRSVNFPINFDVYEFCSETLKQQLHAGRELEVKIKDKTVTEGNGPLLDTGAYELIGLVTHKGRSANSGHYVGWVKVKDKNWVQYDDDIVTDVKEEEILNLKGGGDWHTIYIALYKKVQLRSP